MVSKKRSSGGKKNTPSLWQWAVVALAAFGLYKGLDHFLSAPKKPQKPPAAKVSSSPLEKKSPAPSPTPQASAGPVAKWDFRETARLLPEGSFPDNYRAIPLKGNEIGLLAHAKLIPGKKPGPKGLTNTRPALSWYRLEGGRYRSQDLDFSALNGPLGPSMVQKLSGLPELQSTPLLQGEKTLLVGRLFMGENPMEGVAVVEADPSGIRWAPLLGPDGKSGPAAFLKGTTRLSTREFSTRTHNGKTYLITEAGSLDEAKLYEGYRWKVSAYAWDGKQFVYDKEYSEKLTKEKL